MIRAFALVAATACVVLNCDVMTALDAVYSDFDADRLLMLGLRYRLRLLSLPLLLGAAALAFSIMRHPTYTSTFGFIVQTSRSEGSRISGLAAQFGVSVPGAQQGQTPDFFLELLRSTTVLTAVIDKPMSRTVNGAVTSTDMLTLLNAEGANDEERREVALRGLRDHIRGSVGIKTGLVNVAVVADSPELAQEIGRRMAAKLIEHNVTMRQSRATLERQFIEGRLRQARDSLNSAETALAFFRERNRGDARAAPALQSQLERLEREVNLQMQLFLSLSQSESQTLLETLRNTPDITLVEAPSLPVFRDPRRAGVLGAIGIVVGAALAVLWVFASEWKRTRRPQ